MPSPITDAEIDQLFADARPIRVHVCPVCAAVVVADGPGPGDDSAACDDCAKSADASAGALLVG